MTFEIITLFPNFFNSFFKTGMINRAIRNGVINYKIVGMRKHGEGRLKKVDDTPYGGTEGMLIKKNILENCLKECRGDHVVYLSPRGSLLNRNKVKSLSQRDSLILICGHYEGVDQRFVDRYSDEEISIGDYILSGGETASLVLMEAVSRYLNGFMGNPLSTRNESFESQRLEHDQFTKPYTSDIPRVLVSGNHQKIEKWKRESALISTYKQRPDLLKRKSLKLDDEEIIKNYFYQSLSP